MAFLIGGANSAADTGYDIDNSLRFNRPDNSILSLNIGSDGDRRQCTISMWVKKSHTTERQMMFYQGDDNGNSEYVGLEFRDGGELNFFAYQGEATVMLLRSSALFRDPSAWYHIVANIDTDQGTAADRANIYVNGTQITDFSTTAVYPDQNTDLNIGNNADDYIIGGAAFNKTFDGYISEVYYIDGTQYAASAFGETNDDGIWIPKEAKDDVTFGTNGFFLEFKNSAVGSGTSSTIGADTSGEDNHLTSTNVAVTDQCTDTPTNNFATLNPLMAGRGSTLSEGNLKVSGESDNNYDVATFGSSMKWYMEWKVDENYDGAGGGIRLGAMHEDELATNDNFSNLANATAKQYTNSNDGKTQDGNGDNVTTGLTRATTNDIIMCACDGAGAKIWWGVNGTWLDYGSGTGDPAAGSNAAEWTTAMKAGIWFPATIYSGTAAAGTLNLGNPPNAISSSQADDAGYGNFEYDVPAGFYALCTKNLAEYG